METETLTRWPDLKEPSHAAHEPNALDSSACPICRPTAYAANHARHRAADDSRPACDGPSTCDMCARAGRHKAVA